MFRSYQAPPSMGFSRQEYWHGLPLPSLWLTQNLPDAYRVLSFFLPNSLGISLVISLCLLSCSSQLIKSWPHAILSIKLLIHSSHSRIFCCFSVTQSNFLRPHGLQHPRLPCPSHLLELAQTHVHRVGDAIQPSHPLLSPSQTHVHTYKI